MPRRPLTGEPLALDLVNTWWVHDGHDVDLFDDDEALAAWLAEHDLADEPSPAAHRATLREVRAAIRGVLEETPGSTDALDATLAHGRLRLVLADGRAGEVVELDDPAWGPAWSAARAFLDVLATAPSDRIRHCAGSECVPLVPRHLPQRRPALVLDGRVRQPREGARALPPRPEVHPALTRYRPRATKRVSLPVVACRGIPSTVRAVDPGVGQPVGPQRRREGGRHRRRVGRADDEDVRAVRGLVDLVLDDARVGAAARSAS